MELLNVGNIDLMCVNGSMCSEMILSGNAFPRDSCFHRQFLILFAKKGDLNN